MLEIFLKKKIEQPFSHIKQMNKLFGRNVRLTLKQELHTCILSFHKIITIHYCLLTDI